MNILPKRHNSGNNKGTFRERLISFAFGEKIALTTSEKRLTGKTEYIFSAGKKLALNAAIIVLVSIAGLGIVACIGLFIAAVACSVSVTLRLLYFSGSCLSGLIAMFAKLMADWSLKKALEDTNTLF